jgi:hypothetical protein
MPFTGSHVAAVLPLARLTRGRVALVPAALTIGSMAPDIPYYLPQPFPGGMTHQWLDGVLSADVLLGLGVFAVWQALVAPALVLLAPRAVRARLPVEAGAGLRRFLRPVPLVMTLVSLVVGAATHVIWDAFTHPGGWGTTWIPWLTDRHGPYLGSQWGQVGSSVVGLVAIAGWLLVWWRRTSPAAGEHRPEPVVTHGVRLPGVLARTAASLVVLAAGALGAGYGLAAWLQVRNLHGLAWYTLTGAGSAAGAAAVLVAAVTRAQVRASGIRTSTSSPNGTSATISTYQCWDRPTASQHGDGSGGKGIRNGTWKG